MIVSTFKKPTDTAPTSKEFKYWGDLVKALAVPLVVADKEDAGLVSPTRFRPGGHRCKEDAIEVCAFVADFDDGLALDDFQDGWDAQGLRYIAHTTFSHTEQHQKWRVWFDLAEPVPADRWPDAWARMHHALTHGHADPSCKDASRAYYRYSHAKDAPHECRISQGANQIDPWSLPPPPTPDTVERPASVPGQSGRPGDDFNLQGSWSDCFPEGWQLVFARGGREYWRRPGKTKGWSAVCDDCCTVFTSSVAGLDPGGYSRFGLFARLRHGGDFAQAARELRGMGYGSVVPEPIRAIVEQIDEPPPVKEYNLTDLGNAERMADACAGKAAYCSTFKRWMGWDDSRWQVCDDDAPAVQLASRVVRGMYVQAAAETDPEKRRRLADWAMKCESASRIGSMVSLASKQPGVSVSAGQLDQHPYLLGCTNGVLDLKTGSLNAPDPKLWMTKSTGCAFDFDAFDQRWLDFYTEILPDSETRAWLWRWLGLSLVGATVEHIVPFLIGKGRNGKTVLDESVRHALGDYAVTLKIETLISRHNAPDSERELLSLRGARLASATETDKRSSLSEAMVKRLSGSNTIRGRMLYAESHEFAATHSLWVQGNEAPKVNASDDAFWNRWRVIPFPVSFYGREDTTLLPWFREHASAVLCWLAAGLEQYQQQGLGWSETIREATDQYRREEDILTRFLEEECETGPGLVSKSSVIYTRYAEWCKANNERPLPSKLFKVEMERHGHTWRKTMYGNEYMEVACGSDV